MNTINDNKRKLNSKLRMPDLSKLVSKVLRHEPWLYELELDEEGWVNLDGFLNAMKLAHPVWQDITETDLELMITLAEKKRYEIKNGKIRALYGHSIPGKLIKTPAKPPELLYHGTTPEIVEYIKQQGLLPMGRQYVHLSTDQKIAEQVGSRKCPKPIVLMIQAKRANDKGVNFYQGNELIWLADSVPANFIHFPAMA